MTKKNRTENQTPLAAWLFGAPVKFALYALFLPFLLMLIYVMIAIGITGNVSSIPTWPMFAIFVFGLIVAGYKLIRTLGIMPLGRRGFVAISTGAFITVRAIGLGTLFAFGLIYFPMMAAFMNPGARPIFAALMTLVLMLLGLVGIYVFGIQVAKLYATYLRAIDMGVPRWKAALSMPFSILWMPGYLLEDKRRTPGQDINIRAHGMAALTDWIIKTPANGWTTIVIMVIVSSLLYGFNLMMWPIFILPLGIFILWLLIAGPEKMRKNIGGGFATLAVIVNILTIISVISINVIIHNATQTQNQHAIEITQYISNGGTK